MHAYFLTIYYLQGFFISLLIQQFVQLLDLYELANAVAYVLLYFADFLKQLFPKSERLLRLLLGEVGHDGVHLALLNFLIKR